MKGSQGGNATRRRYAQRTREAGSPGRSQTAKGNRLRRPAIRVVESVSKEDRVDNEPDRTKQLSDARASIYRAAKQFGDDLCDRMVVEHFTGTREDVVIYKQNGQRRVALLRVGLGMVPGSSPDIPVSAHGTEWLEPMGAKDEKRLLDILDLVESTPRVS